MIETLANLRQRWSDPETWVGQEGLRRAAALLIATIFVLLLTAILSFDALLPGSARLNGLNVGDLIESDVYAPHDITYESAALTARAHRAALDAVEPFYEPPDPGVARVQLNYARQILDYIANVRLDPYGTRAQKLDDLNAIAAFTLDTQTIERLLDVDDVEWRAMDAEINAVLERVMREPIRQDTLSFVVEQLPTQVSLRLSVAAAETVVAVTGALIRPNQFENPQKTEQIRRDAVAAVATQTRSFVQGQLIISAGTRLDAVDYETLDQLGLLREEDTRWQTIARALLISVLLMVGMGLYVIRFQPDLRDQPLSVALFAALFLITVLGAQVFTSEGEFYLYPAAGLTLMLVSLARPELALVSGIALAILIGLLTGGSLEATTMAALGSLVGVSSLRRTERVNTYFVAGLMVALVNLVVLTIFNLSNVEIGDTGRLFGLLLFSLINGLFAAASALAGMYIVTLLFNLPTSFKLVDLSQPSQPLLQRMLREAPGTYQHSLQVANLSEQAANAIGANAQLVRVAALYHDIGKMLNPAFFVENQVEGVNPHEQMNDPYRSADIIIQHVTDGEKLARQYNLPGRIIDFIMEHHGTTLVAYFYRQAHDRAGNPDTLDISQFRYPGPRPRSRETAILMLADTCESTVRARKPTTRAAIAEIVDEMFDLRLKDGQIDDSALTSRDFKIIRAAFIEMLQAVYHPRINYPSLPPVRKEVATDDGLRTLSQPELSRPATSPRSPVAPYYESPADTPLPEVPPLRRGKRANSTNGKSEAQDTSEEARRDGIRD
jgi:cyclic-di-AMP phosphodiesterase PgpH